MDRNVLTSSHQEINQIDMLDFLVQLWHGKFVIAAFVVVAVAIAGIYTLSLTERWTSISYVSEPRIAQIKAYLERLRAMARVDGNKTVDPKGVTKALFERFIALSVSARHKKDYLERTEYYQRLSVNAPDARTARLLLSQLERDALRIEFISKNQISPYYQLSFTGDSPEEAQEILRGYIDAINDESFRLVDQEFNDTLDARILTLQTELSNIDFTLKSERDNRIGNLEIALDTARKAGLTDYRVGRKLDGNTIIELNDTKRAFMLGEKYLLAELSTAREVPIIFPTRYYEVQRELTLFKSLRKYDVEAWSYDYQLEPTLPAQADGVKRILILLLAAIVGGMMGCICVLLIAVVRARTEAQLRESITSSGPMIPLSS